MHSVRELNYPIIHNTAAIQRWWRTDFSRSSVLSLTVRNLMKLANEDIKENGRVRRAEAAEDEEDWPTIRIT